MIKDFDTMWQMYVTVAGGVNDALILLGEKDYKTAAAVLKRALQAAEELYISSEQSMDELEPYRE